MKAKRKDSNGSIATRRSTKAASRRASALNIETQAAPTLQAQESAVQAEPPPQQEAQVTETPDEPPSPLEAAPAPAEASNKTTELQPKNVASASQPDGLSLMGASTVASTIAPTPIDSDLRDATMSHSELIPDANVSVYNSYTVGPSFGCKFPIPMIRLMIEHVLKEKLNGKNYNPNDAVIWTRDVADDVNLKMKGACHQTRYKHVVNVILYQQTGAGCFYGARAIWDLFSDDFISINYDGGSFVCIVTLFGCYQY